MEDRFFRERQQQQVYDQQKKRARYAEDESNFVLNAETEWIERGEEEEIYVEVEETENENEDGDADTERDEERDEVAETETDDLELTPEEKQKLETDQGFVMALLVSLFNKQDERAACIKKSKELASEMNRIKAKCGIYMKKQKYDELKDGKFGRKLCVTTRKIRKKVERTTILDWVEDEFGESARRKMEGRIKQLEAEMQEERPELRINYVGMRKKDEKVAPAKKRASTTKKKVKVVAASPVE